MEDRFLILVIDPHPILSPMAGPFELSFTHSTVHGLKALEEKKFHLIFTENAPPAVDGFSLLNEMERRQWLTPVVFLTKEQDPKIVRQALQAGANEYLFKGELSEAHLPQILQNVLRKSQIKMEQQERETTLKEQAEKDGLTGLYNQRFFRETIVREFERARRYQRPLSLLLMDLDGFKSINDTCGHPEGDRTLIQISQILLQGVRFVDIVSRIGGDEFAILLPETEIKSAVRLADRLLKEIRKNPLLFNEKIFPLSSSLGVSCFHPALASADHLIAEADRALYEAKKNGRNRIVVVRPSSNKTSNTTVELSISSC